MNEGELRRMFASKEAQGVLPNERLEPGYPIGLPDILWVSHTGVHRTGFIELKWGVKVVRPEQRTFLRRISSRGGSAFVLAMIENNLYLVEGNRIPMECTIETESSSARWDLEKGIDWRELRDIVTGSKV